MADDVLELLYVRRDCGSESAYCGYRRELLVRELNAVEAGLIVCHVCGGLLREANMHQGDFACLLCAANDEPPQPVYRLINVVKKLTLKCPLVGRCDWVGVLSEAEEHLKGCLYLKMSCECNCVLERKDFPKHLLSQCRLRRVNCEYCNETCSAEELTKHLGECLLFPTVCTSGCGQHMLRNEQVRHSRDQCPLAEVDCPYKRFGCNAKAVERRCISDHNQAKGAEHLDLLIRSIFEMKLESIRLVKILEKQAVTFNRERRTILETAWNMLSMKYMDGVEWILETPNKLNMMHGPCFYIGGHKMECYAIYSEEVVAPSEATQSINCCLRFYVRNLECGGDSDIFVNECRSILTSYRDLELSLYGVQEVKCKIDQGKKFDVAEFWLIRGGVSLSRMKVRIYFYLTPPSRLHQSPLFTEELERSSPHLL